MTEQYYNIFEEYGLKHYQLPKVFFTNSSYIKMTNDTKIAWSVLKDRFQLSVKNGWYDERGNIYFIYTNDELKQILNVGNNKLSNIKKELLQNGLLEQVRLGQGKPNRLYVKKPIVSKHDIYKINKAESLEIPKRDFKKSQNKTTRNTEIGQLEIPKQDGSNTDVINTDFNDTDHHYHYQMTGYIWKMKLPMSLKKFFSEKVNVLVNDRTFDITEIEYFYNTYTEFIYPNCSSEDIYHLNDIEFTKTMKQMFKKVDRPISNMEGLIKTWVLTAIHYKMEGYQ
ncbi:replication initiator protein A [Lentibacillus salicampi]|uniref:Replication initiator protein A n=1 Tax=Lentibacillus salicampi TaxID=175306 RepID=A0A4Y9ACK7_9BACI|nr:replication initiator protein A [Lentibacillus salicampi]TFJ93638.1 replication initiator protein A [Lentibacillus salicampi]